MARAVDVAAETTVAPGFSRVGFALRSRLENWNGPPAITGQVAVVTGASSGIGLATATALAGLGATVHVVGRNAERARQAAAIVDAAGPAPVHVDLVDMADTEAVMALGSGLAKRYESLDVLVHNAGTINRSYRATPTGTEETVATQVLGPYVLTATLGPLLRRGSPARVVTVSSAGMYAQPFDLARLEMERATYDGVVAYARAKRAQVVLADAWAQWFAPFGVASFAMHPGWVDTPGLAAGLPRFHRLWRPLLRTPAEGADTIVWLAGGGPAAEARGLSTITSGFFHDRHRRAERRFPVLHPTRPGDGPALLEWCAERTGIETPVPAAVRP